jgi:ribosomal protein S18 acetylase RimI-like enzyme
MTPAPFRFEPLDPAHDRTAFHCGEAALDRYFQTQATQDIRRHVANCFVAIEAATGAIAAYYTLSAASIPLIDLPPQEAKRLPRYPTLPAVRIGRLAVDRAFQRRGLGAAILMNAAHRTLQADAAAFALLVDAKNDAAVAFYEHHGFCRLSSKPRMLFLPLATPEKVFRKMPAHSLSRPGPVAG